MRRPGLIAALCAAAVCVQAGSAGAAPVVLNGVVQSGGTVSTRPLAGVRVALFEATAAHPVVLGRATSDAAGRFAITSPKATTDGAFYLSAAVDRGVELVTVLVQDLPASATFKNLTTVAAG